MARAINLTEVVFTNCSDVQMAGSNTLDKLAVYSARGIINTVILSNV
jgi:hypothetical protein